MINDIKKEATTRMTKSVDALKHELSLLRTGRASTAIVDHIRVNYYGSEMPLSQVATVVVSDARAVFRVEGAKADQALAKLSPVDFATLGAKELRRTRAAQIAAAFWKDGDGFTVVCFRSVASYMMGLLSHSAMTGSELN